MTLAPAHFRLTFADPAVWPNLCGHSFVVQVKSKIGRSFLVEIDHLDPYGQRFFKTKCAPLRDALRMVTGYAYDDGLRQGRFWGLYRGFVRTLSGGDYHSLVSYWAAQTRSIRFVDLDLGLVVNPSTGVVFRIIPHTPGMVTPVSDPVVTIPITHGFAPLPPAPLRLSASPRRGAEMVFPPLDEEKEEEQEFQVTWSSERLLWEFMSEFEDCAPLYDPEISFPLLERAKLKAWALGWGRRRRPRPRVRPQRMVL